MHSLSTHHYADRGVGEKHQNTNNTIEACGDTFVKRIKQHNVMFFFCCVIMSEEGFPFTSIVLDLAATLFTPETPKVFCGLKHFTHLSIGIVVSG